MPGIWITLKNELKETPPGKAYRRWKYVGAERRLYSPERIDRAIRTFLGESHGLTEEQMSALKADIVRTGEKFRFDADEYFLYHLGERTDEEKRAFIPNVEHIEMLSKLNRGKNREIFDNRWETYLRFKPWYRRAVVLIRGKNDYPRFSDFLKRHSVGIVKPLRDHGVQKIEQTIDQDQLFYALLKKWKAFIVEELIIQNIEMAKVHHYSVNTLRLNTIRYDDRVDIIHPCVRFGSGGSINDNAFSGGVACTVNMETGIIYSACDESGHRYEIHPDTGIRLKGFQIPEWDQALVLARHLSEVVPDNRFIGWDLALTDSGWVMVEGNVRGQFVMWQMNDQIGFREEMESILRNCVKDR